MTRNEKRLLGAAIKAVAHFDENEWYDLKREIFDSGYQPEYPTQGAFYDPADREMAKLSDETKAALVAEWRSHVPPYTAYTTDAEILAAYSRVIVEEVVECARRAAYRTETW